MNGLPQTKAKADFPSLLDVIEAHSIAHSTSQWWGPVIGADEGNTDGSSGSFAISSCVQDDEPSSASDRRLKEDITSVGTTVYGLPLYHFRYRDQDGVYEGVMADDVLRVKPSAVSCGADGFMRVNYGSLGLEMRRVA